MMIDYKNTIMGTFMSYNTVKSFKPIGRLEYDSCYRLRHQMMEIVQTRPDVLVLDLANVSFIDSRGLGLLIEIQKAMAAISGKMLLANLNSQALMLLEITNTDKYFEICERSPVESIQSQAS
jgi:anti-sigma B factor antagonist